MLDAAAWQQRLGEQYRDGGDAAAVVGYRGEVDLDRLMQDMPEVTDLLDAQDDAPVIRMINALLAQAARDGASDLHIEPFETHSVVRYRVDGTLRDMVQPRRALHAALVSRIKIMAHLDIAEKRLPQDGRIAIRVGGGRWTSVFPLYRPGMASAPCCDCWKRMPPAAAAPGHGR